MQRVIVGVSGGVDSTFAAIELAKKGYKVIGVNLILTTNNTIINEIISIFNQYDIEFYTLDCTDIFKKRVIYNFINDYLSAHTPNPCSICNPEVKFKFLFEEADKRNADYVATGHYADIEDGLIRKHFSNKDQSYFLSYLPKQFINRIVFPLSKYTKEEVKQSFNFNLKESSDLCFVSNYRNLVKSSKPGKILYQEQAIGYHNGYHNFTIGQRKGIKFQNEPFYVKEIDPVTATVKISHRQDLYSKKFHLTNLHLFKNHDWFAKNKFQCIVRYRSKPSLAKLNLDKSTVLLDDELFAITKGQTAVFYYNEKIVGCGRIDGT